MKVDLLIENAQIVTEEQVLHGCLAINDEKICAVSLTSEAFEGNRPITQWIPSPGNL